MKTNSNGTVLWQKRYAYGSPQPLAVDGGANAVVTGSSGGEFYTAKYAAADGALPWEKRHDFPANSDSPYAVAVAVPDSCSVPGASNVLFSWLCGFDRGSRSPLPSVQAAG